VDNPVFRMRLDPAEPAAPPASFPANQAAVGPAGQQARNMRRLDFEVAAQGQALARPAPDIANGPDGPFMAPPTRGTAEPPTAAVPTVAEAEAQANRVQESQGAPVPRVQNFRFLMVAESVRERDLEVRYNQLERRLDTVNTRLQTANSLMAQIDARLERARLEQDLDMAASEIRRLRLERVFDRPSAPPAAAERTVPVEQTAQPAREASPEPQSAPSERAPVLNLLA
jgi:hypothetical protein